MKGKPVIPPVYLTATYRFENSNDLIDVVQNRSGYLYSRWDNPSVAVVEKSMARLEKADRALGFASGMAAITTTLLAHARAGDRIVAMREIYGGTFELLNQVFPTLNIQTAFVNCWDTERLVAEMDKGVSILYLETPTNPLLRVVDVKPLAQAAHQRGALVVLDATFASPVNQSSMNLGVDMVVHSGTKYLGGHHDVTAGVMCCREACYEAVWNYRKILGGVMDPMTAFLVSRGLQTLELRVERQNRNAMKIAEFLQNHPAIRSVHYPGLASHPDHGIARKQMKGFGGMLSFETTADFEGTKGVMDRLRKIKLATSLGGVTSLANQPITNTHAALNPEERAMAGVSESLVRLSVGVEDAAELITDLEQALEGI